LGDVQKKSTPIAANTIAPSSRWKRNTLKYTMTISAATGNRSPTIVNAHVSPGFRSYTSPQTEQRSR
jgi:hypothetical protein